MALERNYYTKSEVDEKIKSSGGGTKYLHHYMWYNYRPERNQNGIAYQISFDLISDDDEIFNNWEYFSSRFGSEVKNNIKNPSYAMTSDGFVMYPCVGRIWGTSSSGTSRAPYTIACMKLNPSTYEPYSIVAQRSSTTVSSTGTVIDQTMEYAMTNFLTDDIEYLGQVNEEYGFIATCIEI